MLYLSRFNGTKNIYSVARDEGALLEILRLKHNAMVLQDAGNVCRLYPECSEFITTTEERDKMLFLQNFDVLQTVGDGCLYPAYSSASLDNAIVVTQRLQFQLSDVSSPRKNQKRRRTANFGEPRASC